MIRFLTFCAALAIAVPAAAATIIQNVDDTARDGWAEVNKYDGSGTLRSIRLDRDLFSDRSVLYISGGGGELAFDGTVNRIGMPDDGSRSITLFDVSLPQIDSCKLAPGLNICFVGAEVPTIIRIDDPAVLRCFTGAGKVKLDGGTGFDALPRLVSGDTAFVEVEGQSGLNGYRGTLT